FCLSVITIKTRLRYASKRLEQSLQNCREAILLPGNYFSIEARSYLGCSGLFDAFELSPFPALVLSWLAGIQPPVSGAPTYLELYSTFIELLLVCSCFSRFCFIKTCLISSFA